MARKKLAAAMLSLGCLHASAVWALGLGEMELESFLNEPLRAKVDLLNTGGLHADEIKVRLATREDFDKMGLDRAYFLTNIKFEVVVDERGEAGIVMTSDTPVLEPYLDFLIEARWPSGRLLREYTVLIDPPVFSESVAPAVSASKRVEEVEGIPAPAKKKTSETVTRGTVVDVKKSGLAPGAMPQRDFNARAGSSPAPGGRYMISRDDTLWQIAQQAKPEGASVHQTMLDIQRLNPEAFINGNINRIKAGYIVYLPSAADISSADLASALAEVKQQNEAWREGRDAELNASRGPSLRISADPEETGVTQAAANHEAGRSALTDTAAAEVPVIPEGADSEEQIAAMAQQVETLQRIVSLKDEQIAALQSALAEADGAAAIPVEEGSLEGADAVPGELPEPLDLVADDTAIAGEESAMATEDGDMQAEGAVDDMAPAVEQAPAPTAVVETQPEAAKPAAPAEAESGGFMSNMMYILGAALVAIIGFVLLRRRSKDEDSNEPVATDRDVFADVQMQDQKVEVESVAEEPPQEEEVTTTSNRGYGERKHDEYASDVDAADALAEADIYIAYGRHPQAIDLLNKALATEPDNPVYRLKLIEIHTELRDRGAATAQLEQLQTGGDADSIAKAESIMEALDAPAPEPEPVVQATTETPVASSTENASLTPNPFLQESTQDTGEGDFGGLEIEDTDTTVDDLDLSPDFVKDTSADEEELVIADDVSGLSTKMDLARAYLDMGDDEGARQILDEIVAEGSAELKAEARALLDRVG